MFTKRAVVVRSASAAAGHRPLPSLSLCVLGRPCWQQGHACSARPSPFIQRAARNEGGPLSAVRPRRSREDTARTVHGEVRETNWGPPSYTDGWMMDLACNYRVLNNQEV